MKALKQTIEVFGLIQGLLFFFAVKVLKTENHWLNKFNGRLRIRRQTTDFLVFEQVFLDKDYEFPYLGEIKNVIDAGANIGLTSLFYASSHKPEKIISIEPEKNNFETLCFNCANFENITPINAALWHKKETLTIHEHDLGNWAFTTSIEGGSSHASTDQTIQTFTIPGLMKQFDMDIIDILKIDIEGSEYELFSNNVSGWLPKVKYLIVELHENLKPGVTDTFHKAIEPYNFKVTPKAENLILENQDLV